LKLTNTWLSTNKNITCGLLNSQFYDRSVGYFNSSHPVLQFFLLITICTCCCLSTNKDGDDDDDDDDDDQFAL